MAKCYNSWLCEQAENEYDRADRIQEACEKISDELMNLLENNGFSSFYHAIANTTVFENAITDAAKSRYPKLFNVEEKF